MGFFDDGKNIQEYIKMSDGYDGRELIELLKKYLKKGSSVLELGMGPGKDFDILNKEFEVTGSDSSSAFLELNRKRNKTADLVLLDAVKMNIDRKFDCIYSNKVLHHLKREELIKSLVRQSKVLTNNGLLFHTLWYGDKEEEYSGLRFVYYTEKTILKMFVPEFEALEIKQYTEMEKADSMYIVLRKKL